MAKKAIKFSMINEYAAAIDIGSRSHFASIGIGNADVREFQVYTESLHEMAKWFKEHKVKTIAMESTGQYWKSPFLLLQDYGFEVILVNAAHTKNVRGRKSDVQDCQWIWQLHSAGLLSSSFQPDEFSEELRTYTRHRKSLIEGASRYISKMQKAMVLMNVHLSVVLTDITGLSGQNIIRAILKGERDAHKLAALANHRVKASKMEIAQALNGHWKNHHLFELEQCWEMYHFHYQQIQQIDEKIDTLLSTKTAQTGQNDLHYTPTSRRSNIKNKPQTDIARYAYQLSDGVDLMLIPGVNVNLIMILMAEVGMDLSKFPSAKHFTSWLGLAPNIRKSGGKTLSSKTPKNRCRLGVAFRQAANAAGNQKDTTIAHSFRKISHRKGRKAAIMATARKLAIIVYNMLTKNQPYCEDSLEEHLKKVRNQKIKNIQKTITKLKLSQNELVFA